MTVEEQRSYHQTKPGLIEAKEIVCVAVRGDVKDWAAYWLPIEDVAHAFHTPGAFLDTTAPAIQEYVAQHGHKLPMEFAKFTLFPQVEGAYRD